MEFVTFKIKSFQKPSFERAFDEIREDGKINCQQWEFQPCEGYNDCTIAEIPKDATDQMTNEQIELLKEFLIE